MKSKSLFTILIATILLFSSCESFKDFVTLSGNITSINKSFSDYSGIQVSHAFNVFISFSESEESIEIETNDNLHNYIVVEKSGNNLIIKIKDNINIRRGEATLNAYITTAYLNNFKASGATNIVLRNNIVTPNIDIDLSGASSLKSSLNTNNLYAELSGASDLDISGGTNILRVDASGASTVKGFDFSIDELNIELSGASNAQLSVNNKIDIDASGASSPQYKGSARIINKDLSGASSVQRVN